MGNKPSSTHGAPPAKSANQDILREGRPKNGVVRPPRPTSAPVESPPNITQTPDPNFSLRARDRGSSLITGRFHGNQLHASNPNLPTSDPSDGYFGGIDLSYLPRGVPQAVRPEELDVYRRTVAQVTTIWPEYNLVREIEFETLSPGIRNTLQQILKRLSEQHESIRAHHEHRQELLELQEERNANRQQLRRRDNEIRGLKEELQILRAELVRAGQHLPKQNSIESEPGSNSAQYDDGINSIEVQPENEALNRMKRRERDGIFKATPLLQAEGSREEVKRVVTRNHSLKPVGGEVPRVRPASPTSDLSRYDSGSHSQMERLEAALDRERRENEILKERMTSGALSESSPAALSAVPTVKPITMSEYKERYHKLEALCLGKLAKTLLHQLRHTNRKRQQQFACAVVQKAYDLSLTTVGQFKEVVKALLVNPTNVKDLAALTGSGRDHSPSSLAGHIKILESFKPGQGINNNISKLAKKTVEGEGMSDILTTYMYNYLQSIADVTNITDLVQNVVDALRNEFGDCTTPSLLNQPTFNDFMHDCCRLCWQMCVPDKPLYVSTRDHWRYEERYHVTDSNSGTTNARIDYYMWPILLSRMSGGEVLYKGRVSLKL